jgi:hypothetical protein
MRSVVGQSVVMLRMAVNSREQPTRGGLLDWELGKGLTPYHKQLAYFGMYQRASELDRFFGKTQATA